MLAAIGDVAGRGLIAIRMVPYKQKEDNMLPLPNKKYQIIYADPPWRYENKLGNNPKYGGITHTTMETEEIVDLKVSDIADKNSALFLWVTMPKLQESFKVINGWGFKYITCAFVWIKINPFVKNRPIITLSNIRTGIGNWTNSNVELCLLAKRGNIRRIKTDIKQVQFYPCTKHSVKPAQIRDKIVQLMGNLPRIELFARPPKDRLFEEESYKGWDLWGNEV